jgi:hypothetical protein
LQVEEFELPKASTVCSLVILSYFLVTAGIAYDIINEPPAIGGEQDPVTGAALTGLLGSDRRGTDRTAGLPAAAAAL